MKYKLLIITTINLAFLAYKYLSPPKNNDAYIFADREQANPFKSPKEKGEKLFDRKKRLLSGGKLQENDSLLFMPYYNDY